MMDWSRLPPEVFAKMVEDNEEEQKCTECLQYGRVNHRGVCEFCEDPYGVSALMELVELEEAVLRSQE